MPNRSTRGERNKRLYIIPLILLALSFIIFGIWYHHHHVNLGQFIQESGSKKYNILLITIDTLRADRLGCYGFKEISTPNIDGLAASGVRFRDTTAHVPLTLPAHTSILSGHFPSYHGVHDNGGFYVPKNMDTLAEVFKRNGFSTAAFVAAYVLDSVWGLNQGFDTYYDHFDLSKEDRISLSGIERKADDIYNLSTHWLDEHGKERFFLWTHFYDPHSPYEPPPEFDKLYPGRPYVGEIAYTDSVIGKLLAYLDAHGLREKTIILLTGDHGESLGEHGESTHAFFVYDATLHVPMIISAPEKELKSKVVMEQARSVDIFPTLLQLAGIDVPEDVQGRSLLHLIFSSSNLEPPPSYAEAYYPQYHFGWSRLLSLRTSSYKYIDAPKPELYDLKKDPAELENVYAAHKDIASKMKQDLLKISEVKAHEAKMVPGAIDAETHEKLAALGYIGAFSGPVTQDPLKLPDPKDKIDLFNLISSARQDSLSGDPAGAIKKFQEALHFDPNIVDAHFLLGNEYFRQKEYLKAIEEFKQALSLKPDYSFAMINLANCYEKTGDLEAALVGFEHFLDQNPQDTQILYHIGRIYLDKGQPDEALVYLTRALKTEPDTSWVMNSIGVVYIQKKNPQKAEEYFHQALEQNPKISTAHFNLAQLYESQGKKKEAEQEYLAELEVAPKNYKAQFNLGRFYVSEGDFPRGIDHLNTAVELSPEFPLGYLFLAQAYVENGADLDKAIELAKKGLSLKPDPEYRPLGHFILADIYNRLGRYDLEKQELALAKKG